MANSGGTPAEGHEVTGGLGGNMAHARLRPTRKRQRIAAIGSALLILSDIQLSLLPSIRLAFFP